MEFREVVSRRLGRGALFLHSMPGRNEHIRDFVEAACEHGVSLIVSLASLDEIASRSPSYAAAMESGALPCPVAVIPVEDFGVPSDRSGFADLVLRTARGTASGDRVLVHCGAGIGRTGTFAECLLLALGAAASEAQSSVAGAGSHPETAEQRRLVDWFAGSMPGKTRGESHA